MGRWIALLVLVIALVVLSRTTLASGVVALSPALGTKAQRENYYGKKIVSAYRAADLPPEYGLATVEWESGHTWNPSIKNSNPLDGWGMFQITPSTAARYGVTDPNELLDFDTALATNLSIVLDNVRTGGQDIDELASLYNSGKPLASAPDSTSFTYVPNIRKLSDAYRERINAGEFDGGDFLGV